jgi:hypothetical protein
MCKQVNDKKSRSGGKPSIQTMVAVARDATVILGLISAAVGIAMSAYTYTATQWRKDAEQKRSQLSTYSTYGQYLKKYQDTIQPSLGRIMADGRYKALLDGPTRDMKCGQIISEETETQTGFELWGSKSMEDFRAVHNFYESIGFGVANSQLDFQIIFDLITYPEYWNIHTQGSAWYGRDDDLQGRIDVSGTFLEPDFRVIAPMAQCLGRYYFGINKPLSDFSDNVLKLGYNYLFARMKYTYKSKCKQGRALVVEGRRGKKEANPQAIVAKLLDDQSCAILKRRIDFMANESVQAFPWAQLYQSNINDVDPLLRIQLPGTGTTKTLLSDWSIH